MAGETVQIHGVTLTLNQQGAVEASVGGGPIKKSDSVESVLLFFLLREMQALNGALRDTKIAPRNAGVQSIFPP